MQKTYYIQLEDGQYIIVSMDRDGIHGNAYNYDQDKEQQK